VETFGGVPSVAFFAVQCGTSVPQGEVVSITFGGPGGASRGTILAADGYQNTLSFIGPDPLTDSGSYNCTVSVNGTELEVASFAINFTGMSNNRRRVCLKLR